MGTANELIGSAFIIFVGFAIGQYITKRLRCKVMMLLEITEALKSIHNDFLYRQSDVIVAFAEADKIKRRYFDLSLKDLKNAHFKEQLDKRIAENVNIERLLNDAQIEKLADSLLLIGTGSLEEECGRLGYYINYFNSEYSLAIEYEKRNKKLFLAMSLYASIVLAVILM